jgi:hypothetical protein
MDEYIQNEDETSLKDEHYNMRGKGKKYSMVKKPINFGDELQQRGF